MRHSRTQIKQRFPDFHSRVASRAERKTAKKGKPKNKFCGQGEVRGGSANAVGKSQGTSARTSASRPKIERRRQDENRCGDGGSMGRSPHRSTRDRRQPSENKVREDRIMEEVVVDPYGEE